MNDKFFQLPLEKQERIINAAYKVFAYNSYKNAPMSEIAEAGDISKALLFHYFKNKKELYLFLWDNAIEQVRKVAKEYGVWESTDFFEIIYRGVLAKCKVIRTYPCLYQFTLKAYYEQDTEIKVGIQKNFIDEDKDEQEMIWKSIDTSNLRDDIDIKLLYKEIKLVADGYLRQMMLSGKLDADKIEKDFTLLIEQWKKIYYK
jgi:AcrR family transcriptional regulator